MYGFVLKSLPCFKQSETQLGVTTIWSDRMFCSFTPARLVAIMCVVNFLFSLSFIKSLTSRNKTYVKISKFFKNQIYAKFYKYSKLISF